MSYERRLEIEALPAEEGFGQWQGIVGHATELVERKQLVPISIWIVGASGPQMVEAYRYENWRFSENKKPVDKRWFTYTRWHTNYEYTDYSPRNANLSHLCAETREELCEKARAILDKEIASLRQALAARETELAKFQ